MTSERSRDNKIVLPCSSGPCTLTWRIVSRSHPLIVVGSIVVLSLQSLVGRVRVVGGGSDVCS